MFENLKNRLLLLAIAAIAAAEMWAAKQLDDLGVIVTGPEKKDQAKAFLKLEYRELEKPIPILNATEIDDVIVDKAIDAAIDKGFELVGDGINAARKLIPVSSTIAPELPVGGLE